MCADFVELVKIMWLAIVYVAIMISANYIVIVFWYIP